MMKSRRQLTRVPYFVWNHNKAVLTFSASSSGCYRLEMDEIIWLIYQHKKTCGHIHLVSRKKSPFWWCCERKYRWFHADKIMKGGASGRASSTGIWQCGTSAYTLLLWQPRCWGGSIAFLPFSATKWHHHTLSSKVARSICNFFSLCQGKGASNPECFLICGHTLSFSSNAQVQLRAENSECCFLCSVLLWQNCAIVW